MRIASAALYLPYWIEMMKKGKNPRRRNVSWFGTVRMRDCIKAILLKLRRTARDNPPANGPLFAQTARPLRGSIRGARPERSARRAAWGKKAWTGQCARRPDPRPGG